MSLLLELFLLPPFISLSTLTGDFLNNYFFMFLTPIGLIGNILSFLVSFPLLYMLVMIFVQYDSVYLAVM